MLALIAPGQGSQSIEMLTSWIVDSDSKNLLNQWSKHIDLDLLYLGTAAKADEITDTANAQPLIVATSLLAAHALDVKKLHVVSGHSIGELTAAALCGAISAGDALRLVRARGVEMAKAATHISGGMSAVLGGDRDEVLLAIRALNLIAANENGAGQIVAAGDLTALAALAANPPSGARVRALDVSGAFHTSYMASAVAPVQAIASGIARSKVFVPFISKKDGAILSDADEILRRIIDQIANPVRWDLCMATLRTMGVTGVIELAPAKTLVGLLKRAQPEIESFALKSADDIAAAREFAGRHV